MGNGPSITDMSELEQGELLGAGALCQVYKARVKKTGADVALKRFYCPDLLPEDIEDFKRELELTSTMVHPNIIQFLGGCSNPPQLYLVMELANFGSLAQNLHDDKIEFDWMLKFKIASDTAAGMDFLHSKKVLHRDLKSENLLLVTIDPSAATVVKIADLGVSKLFDPNKATNMTKGRGTTNWMAPEILSGARDYSFPVDVYSYGMIMWELLTREMPWSDPKLVFRIAEKVIGGERPIIPDDCPTKWKELMTACWDGDAGKRPTFPNVVKLLQDMKSELAPDLPASPTRRKSSTLSKKKQEQLL